MRLASGASTASGPGPGFENKMRVFRDVCNICIIRYYESNSWGGSEGAGGCSKSMIVTLLA